MPSELAGKPTGCAFCERGIALLRKPWFTLALILAAALGMRLYGINWDQGHWFHPDERSIYMRVMEMRWPSSLDQFLDADKSPLNPHWFPLGNLLLYVLLVIKTILSPIVQMDMQDLAFAGRSISILADVASVYLLYLLGRRLYGEKAGLLAAALWTVTVAAIQHSIIYRPEPFLVLSALATVLLTLRLADRGSLKDAVLLGLALALGFAVKASALPLLVPVAVGLGVRLMRGEGGRLTLPDRRRFGRAALEAIVVVGVAVVAFVIVTPYAVIDLSGFLKDVFETSRLSRQAGIVPFTVQYLDTTSYWYEISQTAIWSMGLPLGVAAWAGITFLIARFRRLSVGEWLMLAWVVPSFLLLGAFQAKFLRYVFPILPFLVLAGSHLMVWCIEKVRSRKPDLTKWAIAGATLVVLATVFYAVASVAVYSRPHPAVQASRWINANLPIGTTIATDNHWDEGFPDMGRYYLEQLPMYEPDTQAKMKRVAETLSRSRYLIFHSNRTYGSIARAEDKYPLSSHYYWSLFSGELGYTPVRAFTSYPEMFEVAFVDDTFTRAGLPEPDAFRASGAALILNLGYADETVVDYDHPKVLLFENTGRMPAAQLTAILTAAPQSPEAGGERMLSVDELKAQREGGTWTEVVRPDSWANRLPVLSWWLLVEFISLAALPLAFLIFRRLPDRGVLWAKPLGILGVSYIIWMLASLKLLAFSRVSMLVALLIVGGLSAIVLRCQGRELVAFLRKRWRLVLLGEVLFLAAFLSFVAIRMANPDLWHPYRGGEKPMDFAYFNAIIRSTYMPPYDPWFSGGYLNYYYWGQFVVAALTKTLGIVPGVAYNLAVPLLFALTVAGAFALVYGLTEGLHRRRVGRRAALPPAAKGAPGSVELPLSTPLSVTPAVEAHERWSWGPVLAGLGAAAFVAVLGNLDGIVQTLQGIWDVSFLDRHFSAFDFWRSSRMIPALADMKHSVLRFWIPQSAGGTDMAYDITEFPFFTFLFADLHAHLVAIPFTLLALGLAFSLMLEVKESERRGILVVGVVLGVALGALAVINTWDYPPYIVLVAGVVTCGALLGEGRLLTRLGLAVAVSAGVLLVSYLAFLPFHQHNVTGEVGIEASKWATPLYSYFGMFGLFLVIIAALLARHWRLVWEMVARSLWADAAVVGGVAAVIWLAAAGYWTAALAAVLLIPAGMLLAHILINKHEDGVHLVFPLGMLAMALAITFGIEFIRMKPDIARMNTLFKLYIEVWVFLALASAWALWYLLAYRRPSQGFARRMLHGIWIALVVLLVGCGLIYTVAGTRDRLRDRFAMLPMTLDGTAYMQEAVYSQEASQGRPSVRLTLEYDAEAIEWLEQNVQGSPVILEGRADQYQWGSRISIYTGLPTILGWHWHQTQQRPTDTYSVDGRRAIVEEIYNTTSPTRAMNMIRNYSAKYVIVGELERTRYSADGLAKFDALDGSELMLAYQNPGVKIYEVLTPK